MSYEHEVVESQQSGELQAHHHLLRWDVASVKRKGQLRPLERLHVCSVHRAQWQSKSGILWLSALLWNVRIHSQAGA